LVNILVPSLVVACVADVSDIDVFKNSDLLVVSATISGSKVDVALPALDFPSFGLFLGV
jgi:hypothetical protein